MLALALVLAVTVVVAVVAVVTVMFTVVFVVSLQRRAGGVVGRYSSRSSRSNLSSGRRRSSA